MSEACLEKTAHSDSPPHRELLRQSSYIATATETIKNYAENWAGVSFKDNACADDSAGKYAFQRLRKTWFSPKIDPKFRLRRDANFRYRFVLCRWHRKFLDKAQDRRRKCSARIYEASAGQQGSVRSGIYKQVQYLFDIERVTLGTRPRGSFPPGIYRPGDKHNLV